MLETSSRRAAISTAMCADDQQPSIQAEDPADHDSALGSDESTLTESLRSSLLESVRENGRGYHRYKSTAGGEYPLPEDEGEQERLEIQHEAFLRTFGGKLYLSPLGEGVREVLDLGTGTGIWVSVHFHECLPSLSFMVANRL